MARKMSKPLKMSFENKYPKINTLKLIKNLIYFTFMKFTN